MKAFYFILLLLSLLLAIVVLILKGTRESYNEQIAFLESFILRAEVNGDHFRFILRRFREIAGNNQDYSRTLRAWWHFCERYKSYVDALLIAPQEEFDAFVELQSRIKKLGGFETKKEY